MSTKTLRRFQTLSVDSGVDLFLAARDLLNASGADAAGRAAAINHNGYLLIEAPTGSGKTLMAGTMVEKFSHEERVVWFWFAPFKGVVGQTAAFLREQFHGLRLRELADDRATDMSRQGDVFVTTWQTVATRVKDKRNVRKEGETNPSIDTLIEQLRTQGFRIGVVVDEAHHGFGEGTQAAKFFKEVLKPEYTVLITATPDDADVKAFEDAMGIAELHRIRVSREDAMEAGLIKKGVKCAAYFVEPEKKALVDLQGTALRDGVAAHNKLKQTLADMKVPLVPLLLVQADSEDKSVEKLKARLLRMGFKDEQIATHTAEEPDANLLALANEERVEVLIFKMAVALGFDAPRAFTLVSMRASRDPEFGVQLVGRILRVHRLLQGRAQANNLPEALNYGYVFLAAAETQTGLDIAGQKINAIQTEYAKASTATVALRFGEGITGVSKVDERGQIEFFGLETEVVNTVREGDDPVTQPPEFVPSTVFDFGKFFGSSTEPDDGDAPYKGPRQVAGPVTLHRYALRADAPRHFKTQEVCADNEVTEEDCAQRFIVSTRDLLEAMKNNIPVEKRTLDVFAQTIQQEFNFAADLSASEAAKKAYDALCKNKTFDPRELRRALLRKLEAVMRDEMKDEASDPEKVAHFLNVILATHPELLWEAQKKALAAHMEIQEAEALPAEIASHEPLQRSPRNLYEVMPPGLNGWERDFAQLLDHDPHRLVNWWHRNPPDKPWSVNVLMPSGKGFYPDFIIGIEGRKTEDGALLADPKERFETSQEAPKVLAEHQVYGRVLILAKDGVRWMTVGFDERAKKPVFAQEFSLTDTPAFGTSGTQAKVAHKVSSAKIGQAETTMTLSPSPVAPALGVIPEHAVVRLRHDLKAEDVKAGETGTVVHVYEGGAGYEVEFLGERKRPKLVTVEPADIELAD
jgi:type III restriction enzyme